MTLDELEEAGLFYENREVENGNTFPLPDPMQVHLDGKATDGAAASEYGAGLELPGADGWEYTP